MNYDTGAKMSVRQASLIASEALIKQLEPSFLDGSWMGHDVDRLKACFILACPRDRVAKELVCRIVDILYKVNSCPEQKDYYSKLQLIYLRRKVANDLVAKIPAVFEEIQEPYGHKLIDHKYY